MPPNLTHLRWKRIPSPSYHPQHFPLTVLYLCYRYHSSETQMPPTSFKVLRDLTLGGTNSCPSQLHTKSPIYDRLCDAAACLISRALPAPNCHRWLESVLPSAKRLVACVSGNASRPGASPTVTRITFNITPHRYDITPAGRWWGRTRRKSSRSGIYSTC